jgi:ABC-type lipoprotein release transport system permease subunit
MKTFRVLLIFSRIAFRNIRRNPRRTFFTVFAVASGLICLLVFQALKEGLHREMIFSTISLDAGNIQIHASGYRTNLANIKPIPRPDIVYDALRSSGVKRYASRLKTYAFIVAGKSSVSAILSGIVPQEESRVTFIADKIIEGRYFEGSKGIVISSALAMDLQKKTGDMVAVMVRNIYGEPVIRKFTVVGIYRTELATFDRSHIYLPLPEIQRLLGTPDIITEIAINEGERRTQEITRQLRRVLSPRDYQILTWREIAPDVEQLIQLNNATMNLLILIVFAIVAMGIINTMTTVTFERFRELGTLAAIGTSPGGILIMILLESCFTGLAAMAFGNLIGYGVCTYLGAYGIDLTHLTSANQYFASSHVLKAYLTPEIVLKSNIITLATAVFAGIYPAWKASRLEPVRAILHT